MWNVMCVCVFFSFSVSFFLAFLKRRTYTDKYTNDYFRIVLLTISVSKIESTTKKTKMNRNEQQTKKRRNTLPRETQRDIFRFIIEMRMLIFAFVIFVPVVSIP